MKNVTREEIDALILKHAKISVREFFAKELAALRILSARRKELEALGMFEGEPAIIKLHTGKKQTKIGG